jgi:endonuclease V-like protein UPF0215 family
MSRHIREVKREIRILGLDECNPGRTVGVVVRGGTCLDGVITFPRDLRNPSRERAKWIVESAYFPEIRAIMLHDQGGELDSPSIERITELLTIAISENEPSGRRGYKRMNGNTGWLWVRTRIQSAILKKILAASWTTGKLPEPLRVAHLLARLDLPKSPG